MIPNTLPEWADYVKKLPSNLVYAKAASANTYQFFRMMSNEKSSKEIKSIVKLFHDRLVSEGLRWPNGVYSDSEF